MRTHSQDSNSSISTTVENPPFSSTSTRGASPGASTSTNPTSVSAAEPGTPIGLDLTPSLSLNKKTNEHISAESTNRRRSARDRPAVATYNDTIRSGTGVHIRKTFRNERDYQLAAAARDPNAGNVTTIIKKKRPRLPYSKTASFRVNMPYSSNSEPPLTAERPIPTAVSTAFRVFSKASTVLSKRTRGALESIKQKLGRKKDEEGPARKKPRLAAAAASLKGKRKARDSESDSESSEEPSSESPGSSEDEAESESNQSKKIWLHAGLYAGQDREDCRKPSAKHQQPKPAQPKERKFLPLPMFHGQNLLEKGRDFVMPFEILNPLPKSQAPKNWSNLSRNRYIGDAAEIAGRSKKTDFLEAHSNCVCTPKTGCGEDCHNRATYIECTDNNCRLTPDQCTNRGFAELKWRKANKNFSRNPSEKESNMWGNGIEVMDTGTRGHGVRAMRSFRPYQIICEYTGEVIVPDEAHRRMNEDYKSHKHFYMMDFHNGLFIDATRGSICRFVNHSCDPNCNFQKWTVAGERRMALFAGEKGISVGQELTYDYQFDPFSEKSVQVCLCGSSKCRGVLGPKARGTEKGNAIATTEIVRGAERKSKKKPIPAMSKSGRAAAISSSTNIGSKRDAVAALIAKTSAKRRQSAPAKIQTQRQQTVRRVTSSVTLRKRSGHALRGRRFSISPSPSPPVRKHRKSLLSKAVTSSKEHSGEGISVMALMRAHARGSFAPHLMENYDESATSTSSEDDSDISENEDAGIDITSASDSDSVHASDIHIGNGNGENSSNDDLDNDSNDDDDDRGSERSLEDNEDSESSLEDNEDSGINIVDDSDSDISDSQSSTSGSLAQPRHSYRAARLSPKMRENSLRKKVPKSDSPAPKPEPKQQPQLTKRPIGRPRKNHQSHVSTAAPSAPVKIQKPEVVRKATTTAAAKPEPKKRGPIPKPKPIVVKPRGSAIYVKKRKPVLTRAMAAFSSVVSKPAALAGSSQVAILPVTTIPRDEGQSLTDTIRDSGIGSSYSTPPLPPPQLFSPMMPKSIGPAMGIFTAGFQLATHS